MLRGWKGWKIVGFLLVLCGQSSRAPGSIAWAQEAGALPQVPTELRVGMLDFKNWSYPGPPEELQAWKKALMEAFRNDPAWRVIDISEQLTYRELVAQGYRQAGTYRPRWKVDFILAAQFYAGTPPARADIDLYLIDPRRWRSRQIRTQLRPGPTPPVVASEWQRELAQYLAEMHEAAAHSGEPEVDLSAGPPFLPEAMGLSDPSSGIYLRLLSPSNGLMTAAPQALVEGFTADRLKGGPAIDLLLVIDSSGSLRGAGGLPPTDPQNFRSRGAIRLIQKLPPTADIRIGVVDFDGVASLVAPLSEDREAAIEAIWSLDQDGPTNISGGIDLANTELILHGRKEAAKVEILFTDGQQPLHDWFGNNFDPSVIDQAARAGIVIHTLGLGNGVSQVDLEKIAQRTGGQFVHVTDPSSLPQVFDHLHALPSGIERVTLKAEGLEEETEISLFGGYFWGVVPLRPGPNLIEAKVFSRGGTMATDQLLILRRLDGQGEGTIHDPLYQLLLSHQAEGRAQGSLHLRLAPPTNGLKRKSPPPPDPIHLDVDLQVK